MRYLALMSIVLCAHGGCVAAVPLHTDAVDHNDQGAQLLSEGKLDDAEARFRLALEYNPKFAEAHANLGVVALERGDLKEAEDHLKRAIRLNEDFAEAWSTLGVVHETAGREKEARVGYEQALSIQPGLVDPRRNLSLLLVRHDDFRRARAHLQRLVQIDADDVPAQSLLAYCDVRLDQFDAAFSRAQSMIDKHPDEAVPYVVRGIVHAHREEWVAAESDLRVGLDDAFVGRAAKQRLAAVYAAQGRTKQAWRLVRELLKSDPDDAAAEVIATWLTEHAH